MFNSRSLRRGLEILVAGPHGYRRARELASRERMRPRVNGAWFTTEERKTVGALAAVIVPGDADAPGAIEAGVLDVLERLVASSGTRQGLYARGLVAVDEAARRRHGRDYADLSVGLREELLRHVERAYRWRAPRGPVAVDMARRFLLVVAYAWTGLLWATELFPQLVRDVKEAFYTRPAAWEALRYAGPPFPATEVTEGRSPAVADLAGVSSDTL